MSPLEFRHVTLLLLPIQVFEADIFLFLRKSIVASQYTGRTHVMRHAVFWQESFGF